MMSAHTARQLQTRISRKHGTLPSLMVMPNPIGNALKAKREFCSALVNDYKMSPQKATEYVGGNPKDVVIAISRHYLSGKFMPLPYHDQVINRVVIKYRLLEGEIYLKTKKANVVAARYEAFTTLFEHDSERYNYNRIAKIFGVHRELVTYGIKVHRGNVNVKGYFDRALRIVCSKYDLSRSQLLSKSRRFGIAHARQELMFMLRQHDPDFYSYSEIARRLGGMNHATIMSGEKSHIARQAEIKELV